MARCKEIAIRLITHRFLSCEQGKMIENQRKKGTEISVPAPLHFVLSKDLGFKVKKEGKLTG